MTNLEEDIFKKFGNQLRVRVCGVWVDSNEILLVHHRGLGKNGSLWAPPGGGIEYGENVGNALKREFLEETGIKIEVGEFLFVYEYLDPPLHGIELFFRVSGDKTKLITGTDPEMSTDQQIITNVTFANFNSLKKQEPENLHYILQQINAPNEIFNLKGYFKFR